MAFDRYGRRLTPRGSSPPSSFRSEDIMRSVKLPQRNCFTDNPRPRQVPSRSRTAPQQLGGGPRIPKNRIASLANINVEGSKTPLRVNSATTLQYVKPLSPPEQRRVPPVATVAHTSSEGQQQFDSGLGLERPIMMKPATSKSSIPGYRARCASDSEDDDIQTDYIHEVIKPTISGISTVVPSSQTFKSHPQSLALEPTRTTLQKQDSGIEQQMDTTISPMSPQGGSSFDPETYQRHLDEIQRNATNWSRLQEGLAMLLPNTDGDTGFHHAVIHTKPNVLMRLLELVGKHPQLSSCIDDQNSLYQTSLHLAVHLQQVDMIRMLVNAGASLHLQDHKGNTALHIACQQKSTRCLDQLLSAVHHRTLCELAEIRNFEGNSCAHVAAFVGNTEALLRLQGAGVDIDMKSYGAGKTALHIAVEKSSFQLTQILIQSCGADFNKPMYSGCTPLHVAAGWGNIEIVAYLISLGADPYAVTDEGDMPIDLASNECVRGFLAAVTGL